MNQILETLVVQIFISWSMIYMGEDFMSDVYVLNRNNYKFNNRNGQF